MLADSRGQQSKKLAAQNKTARPGDFAFQPVGAWREETKMNSFTQTDPEHEIGEHDPSRFEGWVGGGSVVDGSIAHREALGTRLALLAQAIQHEIIPRLMLAHRVPSVCLPQPLVPAPQVSLLDVQEFSRLVLSLDEKVAQACIDAMRIRGISIETIYLDLLAPVARHLGELWEQDLCDFTEVTVGLGRLHRVLRELSPAFGQSRDQPASGRRILLLPGPGEQHTFGLVMVAEFFRRAGWDVAGGPWEAGADPVVMVKREWFDVVGFSLASGQHLSELSMCIGNVRKAALNPHVGIMVGGPTFSLNPEYVAKVQADVAVDDGSKAPEMAESLVLSLTQHVSKSGQGQVLPQQI
jgi:MerR family transcriptional regulator, light-induced transcriptional regulator